MDNAPTPAAPSSPSFLRSWAALAVLALAVIAVYGQTVTFDFVTYDDYELVVQNGDFLSSWHNVVTSFTTHAFTTHRAESGYYRPLLLVSYLLDYKLWGMSPAAFHAMNVAIHLLTSSLVFGLCLTLSGRRLVSLLGALLFALHPVQSESVGWVAGRNDLLLGLFVVAMALAYARYRRSEAPRKGTLAAAVLCFTCALFTKESAAFYLLALPLIDLALAGGDAGALFRWRNVRRYAVFGTVLVCYVAIRASVIGALIGAEKLYGTTPWWERVAAVPAVVAEHLRLLLVPAGLSVAHPIEGLVWNIGLWKLAALLVLVGSLGLAVWSWRIDRLLGLGLSWIAVGLLPATNLFPLAVPILEHRLYVPLAGGAVAAAALLARVAERPSLRLPALSGAILLVAAAGAATLLRLPVWTDSETLWRDAIAKAPDYSRSYLNLAGFYYERQRYDLAAPLLEEYLRQRPDDQFASSRLRLTYVQMGQPEQAIAVCRRMIAHAPGNPARYYETALLFDQLHRPDSAAAVCRDALGAGAENADLQAMLGRLLAERGDSAGAMPHLQRALELNPASLEARMSLGTILWNRGDAAAAIATLEGGLTGRPPNELITNLARFYLRVGWKDKAEALLNRYGFR